MTTVDDIKTRLDLAASILREKGYQKVSAGVWIESTGVIGHVKHHRQGADIDSYRSSDDQWHHLDGTAEEIADKAVVFARDAKTTAETAEADYLRLLHKAIDFARQRGLEEPFINPIAELAKKISKNAITDQRGAA